ncbi:MAG: GntR family transcriptional regulator [Succinivibrio sp.]|nr:GntR family transcriptional regulator [Succinivibrio sp.]
MKTPLPAFKINNSEPVSRQIYNYLRRLIVEIKIMPGSRLSENELSEHFEVSRQPVREALFLLKQVDLIEVFPQKGSYITKISTKNLKEICFVRSSLECASILEGLTKNDENFQTALEELKDNIALQQRLLEKPEGGDRDADFLELDDAFHEGICKLSGNSLTWGVIQNCKSNLDRIRYLSTRHVSSVDELVGTHAKICELIISHQGEEAVAQLRNHLFEILKTCDPIIKDNAEWFEED